MARLKVGIAAAGMAVVLLGVVAAATMRGDSGSNRAVTVASQVPAETPTSVGPAPASSVPALAQPTVQDVQKVLAGIMANMAPPAGTTGTTAPLTREQIESQLREQLKVFGITY